MVITQEDYKELSNRLEKIEKLINGGRGSGNFGHSGRPGKVGGSGGDGGVAVSDERSGGATSSSEYDSSLESRVNKQKKAQDKLNDTIEDITLLTEMSNKDGTDKKVYERLQKKMSQYEEQVEDLAAKNVAVEFGDMGTIKDGPQGPVFSVGSGKNERATIYMSPSGAIEAQRGWNDRIKGKGAKTVEIKEARDGNLDIVHEGTDVGIKTYGDETLAKGYVDGFNLAADYIADEVARIKLSHKKKYGL